MNPCECPEHRCDPDRGQTERYPIEIRTVSADGVLTAHYELCALCYADGHASTLRLQYAGLLP